MVLQIITLTRRICFYRSFTRSWRLLLCSKKSTILIQVDIKVLSRKGEYNTSNHASLLTLWSLKYFEQCRQLIDIADCRDFTTATSCSMYDHLSPVFCETISLLCAYIGVALRSALRLGLHRFFDENFTPIEAEARKRVFWVIREMDTYVGTLLGLPHALRDDEIDQ